MLVCIVKKAEKHTKGTKGKIRKKDTSQALSIDMDDEVFLRMNKSPEEMTQEICLAVVVK